MDDHPRDPVTHTHYRREPYVHATFDDGTTVDGKAVGWTRDQVDVKWQSSDGKMHAQWFPADRVERIKRRDSAWQDVYDDYEWYAQQGELYAPKPVRKTLVPPVVPPSTLETQNPPH